MGSYFIDGELLVCGQNHKGQLGIKHATELATLHRCSLLNQRVAQVSCGWDFTVLLTGKGTRHVCIWVSTLSINLLTTLFIRR